jgi:hypothetical protein
MTPRPLARTRRATLLLLVSFALGLTTLAGCDPRQALFFFQPFDPVVAPRCPELKGKRVVLIAKTDPRTLTDFPTIDRDIARNVGRTLREKVKRIDLVEQEKVWAWDKAHPNWSNPSELAEKFEADMVVFLEIGEFQIQSPSSPELFEGKATVNVQVTELAHPKDSRGREMRDMPKESKIIFNDEHVSSFPSRGPLPASADYNRGSFKTKFIDLVSTELSWYFVEHAPGDNIQDVKFSRDQ